MLLLNKDAFYRAMQDSGFKSLSVLAKAAGVHRNSLYPLVRGEVSPFTDIYLSICKTLHVSPRFLLDVEAEEDLAEICKALNQIYYQRQPEREHYAFFLFGSRATGKARRFSDYDIGVTGGENPIAWQEFLDMKESLANLCDDLPVKVSLSNFDQAPDAFLNDFESVLNFLVGNKDSFSYFKGYLSGRTKTKKVA